MSVELIVTSQAYGGRGIARLDGKVYFIRGAVEGDRVRIQITKEGPRFNEAEVTEWVEASSVRGESPCQFSDRCGGCHWIGIDIQSQLDWKRSFVESALTRIAKIEKPEIEIVSQPAASQYRTRVQLKGRMEAGRTTIGYFEEISHNLVGIDGCEVACETINDCIGRIAALDFKTQDTLKFKLELQAIGYDSDSVPQLLATLTPEQGRESKKLRTMIDVIETFDNVSWSGFAARAKDAPFFLLEEDDGLHYHSKPGQFQQANLAMNRALRKLVRETVQEISPPQLLDAFCGSGNLSLGLISDETHVVGVELHKGAVASALHNMSVNHLENAEYLIGATEKHLEECVSHGKEVDCVIVDPPRQGLTREVGPLLELRPPHIIYVSCDPMTLGRDLGKLCGDGYTVNRVVALDFFPNTYHVETFVHLVRD